jgi:hypothetical protein
MDDNGFEKIEEFKAEINTTIDEVVGTYFEDPYMQSRLKTLRLDLIYLLLVLLRSPHSSPIS